MFSQIWQKPIHVSVFRTRCSWALSERKIEQRSLFCPSSTCLEEVLSCAVMLDASFKFSMQPEWPTQSCALPYMFWRIRKNFWQQLELFWGLRFIGCLLMWLLFLCVPVRLLFSSLYHVRQCSDGEKTLLIKQARGTKVMAKSCVG